MKQTLKYIFDKLLELIRIAEAKYSITLALASGVIVLGSSFIGSENLYTKILASATVIFSLISIVYGFVALFARNIKLRAKRKPKKSKNRQIFCFLVLNMFDIILPCVLLLLGCGLWQKGY